mgnify:CR=1 FL=1
MAENKIQLPQSGGGLVRYFEEVKSKIEFAPWIVVIIIIFIIVVELIFHKINLLGF